METPSKKSSQKLAKSSQSQAGPSPPTARGGGGKTSSPLQRLFSSHSWVPQKPLVKEITRPVDIKLHTQQRAAKRALFNSSVAIKLCIMEQQKKQVEKLLKMIEEEEVRTLRKEMIPRAQQMPFFDKPFLPQRSNRPLTVPREPNFHQNYCKQSTRISCR